MLEIRCKKNSDGTYDAGVFQDGQSVDPPNFTLKNATCEEIRELRIKVSEAFPADTTININGDCTECF